MSTNHGHKKYEYLFKPSAAESTSPSDAYACWKIDHGLFYSQWAKRFCNQLHLRQFGIVCGHLKYGSSKRLAPKIKTDARSAW